MFNIHQLLGIDRLLHGRRRGNAVIEGNDIAREAGATRIATAECSTPSRSARNGKLCVPRLRETKFRKDSYAPEPASPNPRWENSESSLRGARDFGAIWRRVRSRELAARPSPARAAKTAANY